MQKGGAMADCGKDRADTPSLGIEGYTWEPCQVQYPGIPLETFAVFASFTVRKFLGNIYQVSDAKLDTLNSATACRAPHLSRHGHPSSRDLAFGRTPTIVQSIVRIFQDGHYNSKRWCQIPTLGMTKFISTNIRYDDFNTTHLYTFRNQLPWRP